MGKETLRWEQTGIWRTILELKTKNSAEGGMLFATFGRGKTEALIFPTPALLEIKDGNRMLSVADFLVVTNHGYKVVHIDNLDMKEGDIGAEGFLQELDSRLGKKEGFFGRSTGYIDGELRFKRISITSESLRLFQVHPYGFLYSPEDFNNWRLMNTSDSQVEKILDLNIKRVKALRTTSKKVSGILNKVS